MQLQKQPLRNSFGQFFFRQFLGCFKRFLILLRISTEMIIPGLHTYVYKIFPHRIGLSLPHGFLFNPHNRYLQEQLAGSVSISVSIIK